MKLFSNSSSVLFVICQIIFIYYKIIYCLIFYSYYYQMKNYISLRKR